MIILQDQYYVFVIQKHVYAFNFQEQYHFILQDHCRYLFSGAVSCSFYRSSDMLILQEHYAVFILQEQCVFILQEQSPVRVFAITNYIKSYQITPVSILQM